MKETSVFAVATIREIENKWIAAKTVTANELMHRAGAAALVALNQYFAAAKKIMIIAGGGNNGGDGYVLATLLHKKAIDVSVFYVGELNDLPAAAADAYKACEHAGVSIQPFSSDISFAEVDLIVDAICGIGLQTPLRKELITVLEKIEKSQLPVLAIDIPTGVHADTGCVLGKAIQATVTITFIGLKLGLLTGKGIGLAGKVILANLDIPPELLEAMPPSAFIINENITQETLPKRSRDWHKGLSGHVLIVGGDVGMSGACQLAAMAALRVGAGLVSVAMHPKCAKRISGFMPEVMCHGIDDMAKLQSLLAKATVIVIGPGLGQSDWSHEIWQEIMKQPHPKVVDADGLNWLAKNPIKHDNWLLTPHPLEAARLLNQEKANTIVEDRPGSVMRLQKQYGGVAILKGAGSLVAAENELLRVCIRGNPGMSTAGMGDVLSGVLGGLLAQGATLFAAAKLGVYIHAVAGDLATLNGGERGMIASDVMPYLHQLVN